MPVRSLVLRAIAVLTLGASATLSGAALAQTASLKTIDLSPTAKLEVTDLRRLTDKGATQLKMVLKNSGPSPVTARQFGFASGFRLDTIELIDFVNKRSYVLGTASRCLCSTFDDGGSVPPGGEREFWAWFGLPPAGVTTLSMQIGSLPPVTDIPLQ